MPLFVLLTRLTGECKQKLREEPAVLEEICKKLGDCDRGSLPQLAVLGPYDFVNLVKVENEKTVYKLQMDLNSRGDIETIVMPAISLKEYRETVQSMSVSK